MITWRKVVMDIPPFSSTYREDFLLPNLETMMIGLDEPTANLHLTVVCFNDSLELYPVLGAFENWGKSSMLLGFVFCVCDFLRMEPFPPFGRISFLEHVPSIEWVAHPRKYVTRRFTKCTPPKFNSSPLKMDGWKMIFLFKEVIFRFHVQFPGCTNLKCHLFVGAHRGFVGLHGAELRLFRALGNTAAYGLTTEKHGVATHLLIFFGSDTVDGWNPAPPRMMIIPLLIGF